MWYNSCLHTKFVGTLAHQSGVQAIVQYYQHIRGLRYMCMVKSDRFLFFSTVGQAFLVCVRRSLPMLSVRAGTTTLSLTQSILLITYSNSYHSLTTDCTVSRETGKSTFPPLHDDSGHTVPPYILP